MVAGEGAPKLEVSGVDATGRKRRVVVIAAKWHTQIMEGLVAGALRVGEAAGVDVRLVRVPGSVELGVAAEAAAKKGVDWIVGLGGVVSGERSEERRGGSGWMKV